MILFATAFLLSLAITLVFYVVLKTICLKELACIVGIQMAIAGVSAAISYYSSLTDVQAINSYVMDKKQVRVSCEHSYECMCFDNCSTDSKGNRSCTKVCQTCYEHSNDWDWDVYTAMGETITINRVDRRGSNEPPRWTKVVMGEPTTQTRSYDNYIKASPGSLFRTDGALDEKTVVPPYPLNVYDYYRLDRLVMDGIQLNTFTWNPQLSRLNAEMGAKHQVNLIVVVAKDKPQQYFYTLRQAWIGGKKNDVILVVNVDNEMRPTWANVMVWTVDPLFVVKLRDAVMDLPKLEPEPTLAAMKETISKYHKRKPMADFKYLKASVTPSTTAWIVTMILQLLATAGLILVCHREEFFPTYRYY
jgi:hypothetical protein